MPPTAVLASVAACTIWGLSAFYYVQLKHVPPLEVLAHRTIWSALFFTGLCAATGRLPGLLEALRDRREVRYLAVSAAMVSVNWGLFIWAVTTGHVAESALGYYIFPLVMAAAGRAFFAETLRSLQIAAVALAATATLILGIGLGAPPWVSITLAVTFAVYGLIKRGAASGPITSVTVEVLILAPAALVWLLGVHLAGWSDFSGLPGGVFFLGAGDAALLAASGVITGAPLALYSHAAKGLPLATLGMIFYLNPTLQAASALALGETPTIWHLIAFPLIWAGLALFSWEAWRRERGG